MRVFFPTWLISLIVLIALGPYLHPGLTWLGLILLALTIFLTGLPFFLSEINLKRLTTLILKIIWRPEVVGLTHFESLADGPALIVANHTSFIDVPLLVAFLPRRLTFAIDVQWSRIWWLQPFLRIIKTLPLNPNQPLAIRGLIDCLAQGETVVIFPEGRITDTGCLMKIYEGPGLIAAKSQSPIVPVILEGSQYSRFSRLKSILKYPPRCQIKMTVHAPRQLENKAKPGETQRDHRRRTCDTLFDLIAECRFQSADWDCNLWTAFIRAADRFGPNRPIMEDIEREPLTYRQSLTKARLLGQRLTALSQPGENIGLLLPNSNNLILTLLGLWSTGRVGVLLNYSQSVTSLISAIATAQVKTVLSSRLFLKNDNMAALVNKLPVNFVYTEDLASSWKDKATTFFWSPHPTEPNSPAAIIFTSGSEGRPKGVVLSHRNILANTWQIKCHIENNENDIFFNTMPMFHSMGLTLCVMFPLLHGIRLFNYFTPLSTYLVTELIYDTRATMTATSDTFAAAWGRNANPYDLVRLHFFLSGSEKVKPATRALYTEKFGIRLFECYGVTEATPMLAVNTRHHYRSGSAGRLMPGLSARLEPIENIDRGGRLLVKGPNIMLGYLDSSQPGIIQPPANGWHDTGDIVEIDTEGFLWIRGRFRRFAKIGGEIISLSAIEKVSAILWPDLPHAIIALEDNSKGAKLALVTQDPEPSLPDLWWALKAAGLPPLTYPHQFIHLPEIPHTPLGKINMPKLIELANQAYSE
ncbi:MAG: hypothetical protein AMR96_05885 [Candidatus Adiutrix intracellularis]|nr:MAG: hypothetical protein AMR96_05885 [Candidatus Adiutrix intracellularis]